MANNGDEVRVIAVGAVRMFAGVPVLLWIALSTATFLLDWPFDGPLSQRIAYSLVLVVGFGLAIAAGHVWRWAAGITLAPTRRDGVYYLVAITVAIPMWVLITVDMTAYSPWRTALLLLAFGALILAAVAQRRDRKRNPGGIVAPIATRTVSTPRGERTVRVGLPRQEQGGWVAWWSLDGAPQGPVVQPAYGPDAVTALAAALADAEAAVAVI